MRLSNLNQYLIKMCISKYYFKFNKMFNGRMFICQFVTEKVLSWVGFFPSITGMLWRNYANCTFVWHILRWIWNNSATLMNRYWFILLHHTRIYKVLMFKNVIFLKQQTTLPHHNGSNVYLVEKMSSKSIIRERFPLILAVTTYT